MRGTKRKRGVDVIVLVLLALSSLQLVAAALPTMINVQGRLTNASTGASLTGSYSVNFTLYDAASGGNSVYTQTQTVVTDSNGLYSVVLTGVTALFDIPYYLGIKVGSDSEMTPRLNLTTSPYAFMAGNVSCTDCLTGTQIDESTLSESDPQVGTATNTYLCYGIAGNVVECNDAGATYDKASDTLTLGVLSLTSDLTANGNVNLGSDNADQIRFSTNVLRLNSGLKIDGAVFGNPALTVNETTSYIGINQPAPTNMFEVNGSIGLTYAASGSYIQTTTPSATNTVGAPLYIRAGNATGFGYAGGTTYIDGGTGTGATGIGNIVLQATGIGVNGGGNVGIKTANPTYELDVNGTGRIQDTSDGALVVGTAASVSDNMGLIHGQSNTTAKLLTLGYVSGPNGITGAGFSVDSDGNLTITTASCAGACSPRTITVGGDVIVGSALTVTSGLTLSSSTVTAPNNLSVDSGTLFIDATNNRVGIGTTAPASALDVNGSVMVASGSAFNIYSYNTKLMDNYLQLYGASGAVLSSTSTGNLSIGNATSTVMTIWPNGNVGIGTTSPARALHINDTLRLQPRSAAPASAGAGDIYYDSDSNVGCLYNGTAWNSFGGSGTCA